MAANIWMISMCFCGDQGDLHDGQPSRAVLWQLNQVFFEETWGHLQMFIWLPNLYFKPNHDVFLTLTKWFLCLT